MKTAIELIAAERKRQIEEEGWSPYDDIEYTDGELAIAATYYALPNSKRDLRGYTFCYKYAPPKGSMGHGVPMKLVPIGWPFYAEYWKPCPDDRIRELVKAGALICAEIDRLRALGGGNDGR